MKRKIDKKTLILLAIALIGFLFVATLNFLAVLGMLMIMTALTGDLYLIRKKAKTEKKEVLLL